ncbi:MAG: TatD family hydrolase [Desulfuromonadaceae bacterium]|nr:TatD family hydrolase [Desulfuromonadaceae bacterium]MDD2854280.1 TatD family hydrolase [Desulfuromonadaceae bacterium]
MSLRLIDTHCHLDLDPIRSNLPSLLKAAESVGVHGFVVPGLNPEGWQGISSLAAEYPMVFPAYGIHPMYADLVTDQTLDDLSIIAGDGFALGETGLDPAFKIPILKQEQVFREQIRIALKLDIPLLVHCRKLFAQTLKIMGEEGASKVGGIMHAYSGSVETAREFIRMGFTISLSGSVTLKNAVKPLRLAKELPMESMVFETDAPYMTPELFHGKYNKPEWIMETVLLVAALRGVEPETIAEITTANANRILRLNGL